MVQYWTIDRPAVAVGYDFPSGEVLPRHTHSRDQLVYASAGVMTVTTVHGAWVVPPQRAVWVPAGVEHQIRMIGAVAMRTVYLRPGALPDAPRQCRVVTVSPLLRELILRAVEIEQPYREGGPEERLIAVLLDEIRATPETPLHLPVPQDERLRRITDALQTDPADSRPLAAWASEAAASARTLARLFQRETGMSFARWRQQLRLVRALEALAQGRSVTETALDLGYESPSAFIAMFRRAFGKTPARYFEPGSGA